MIQGHDSILYVTDLLIDLRQTFLVAADIAQVKLYSMTQPGYMLEDNPYEIWIDDFELDVYFSYYQRISTILTL